MEREPRYRGSYEPSTAFIHFEHSAFLDTDIVIEISAEGLDLPRCSVERWYVSEGAEETTDAYALTVVPKFDIPSLSGQGGPSDPRGSRRLLTVLCRIYIPR
jgi:hypothetical protein